MSDEWFICLFHYHCRFFIIIALTLTLTWLVKPATDLLYLPQSWYEFLLDCYWKSHRDFAILKSYMNSKSDFEQTLLLMLENCSDCKVSRTAVNSRFWSFILEYSILNASNAFVDWFTIISSQFPMSILNTLRLFLMISLKRFLGLCLGHQCCNSLWNFGNLASFILVKCPAHHVWLCMRSIWILVVPACWRTGIWC